MQKYLNNSLLTYQRELFTDNEMLAILLQNQTNNNSKSKFRFSQLFTVSI
jgi:hypothetical protein